MNKFQKNFEQLMKEFEIKLTVGEKTLEAGSEQLSKVFKFIRNGRVDDKKKVKDILLK